MIKQLILLIMFTFPLHHLYSQEYSFDASEFKKKPYEFGGEFRIRPELLILDTSSDAYTLSFLGKEKEDYFDNYLVSLQLIGSYEYEKLKGYADFKDQLIFDRNEEFDNNLDIYEAYLSFNPTSRMTFQAGKISVKWGKGYVFSPVSFPGREKDIQDIEAGKKGFWMVKAHYLKSFSGLIKNFSVTPIYLPVQNNVNEDFYGKKSHTFLLKNYMLIGDVDIDAYLMINDKEQHKLGVDFALNVLPNWEVHGEYAFEKKHSLAYISVDHKALTQETEVHNYLVGNRILLPTNTTVFLEYFHNGRGLSDKRLKNYYQTLDEALKNSAASSLQVLKQYQGAHLNKQFLQKDYAYLKFSHPEPFDLLYFTPSLFVLYNLADNSHMTGGDFNYSGFENMAFKFNYSFLSGDKFSEFGGKMNRCKCSFSMSYNF